MAVLMQGRVSWVALMQDDMEYRKARGESIGAYVTQLQMMLTQENIGDAEAPGAAEALLAAYQHEEGDEARPDRADEFVRKWMGRLRVLLQKPEATVIDSQHVTVDDQAGVLEENHDEASTRRLRKAKRAQEEDDRAMREAMDVDSRAAASSSSNPGKTTAQRPHCREGSANEVLLKRVLVNGVTVQPGSVTALDVVTYQEMNVLAAGSGGSEGPQGHGHCDGPEGHVMGSTTSTSTTTGLATPATTLVLVRTEREELRVDGAEGLDGLHKVN